MIRSFFFVLPHKEMTFERIQTWSNCDAFVLDLEDGCPLEFKEKARELIRLNKEILSNLKQHLVLRVNPKKLLEELKKDLSLLELEIFDGILLPMIKDAKDITEMQELLSSKGISKNEIDFHVLIETAQAVKNVDQIACSADNIKSLFLGIHDLTADTNAVKSKELLNNLRSKIVINAKANGLMAIDAPFLNVKNYAGLFKHYKGMHQSGMDGVAIIHPDHISIVNDTYKTTQERKDYIHSLLNDYEGGCVLTKGEFVGPPQANKLRKELEYPTQSFPKIENSIRPKTFIYGLDLNTLYPGLIIQCPYEQTVDVSWITSWASLVPMGNYIETSKVFANELGLKDRIIPFSAIVNLTLCMAVENFSETCLLHLGLEDVIYEAPAYSGDTFRCLILVESIRNTSDGKRSVVRSTHILLNQRDERIVSFRRNTLFSVIPDIESKLNKTAPTSPLSELLSLKPNTSLLDFACYQPVQTNRMVSKPINENDLILHDAMRSIGESENLAFTTLYKNTHPIHFNYYRFQPEDIVVCGGFLMAMVLGNALKDLKQVISQKIYNCSHLNKVTPGDTLSSATYVTKRTVLNGKETLELVTLGFRELDPVKELMNRDWPKEIFNSKTPSPKETEKFLQKQMPELFHKICLHIHWQVIRY